MRSIFSHSLPRITFLVTLSLLIHSYRSVIAQITPEQSLLFVDFQQGLHNLADSGGRFVLHEVVPSEQRKLEFTGVRQYAELDAEGTAALSRSLGRVDSLSVGGWFHTARVGEQLFLTRGDIQIGPLGERFFRPSERLINFCIGTDQHGFFMGTINGNGRMPFVHVTVNDVPIQTWQHLVVVKDAEGFHHFYQNGTLVHTDRQATAAPSRQVWRETNEATNEPVRLQMPLGGQVGEAWIIGRALTSDEITTHCRATRHRYLPSASAAPIQLREMHQYPDPDARPFNAERMRSEAMKLLGPFPEDILPLSAAVHAEEDCGSYWRRKVSFQVGPQDTMPCWLLVPKRQARPTPAIICFYGTTSGAGKDVTVGLSGRAPGSTPERNLSFAIDMVEAGIVALAPDYLRDGERIYPGDRPYATSRFYEQYPDWSIHGKDIWDTMRAVDYLQSLDFVDGDRIGMVGHSYGGHSTIFTTAFEPRIKVAVANGPVSAFREHGMHWGVPRGASNSQSLPALREFLLNPELPLPITFAEWTALIAPRPLWIGQAVGERRPLEEQNHAYVSTVYKAQAASDRLAYMWYAGDHDFPPEARTAAVAWFRRWLCDEH